MNVYFYTYYIFVKLAKKLGNTDDVAVRGLLIFSCFIFFNVFSVIILLIGRKALHAHPNLIGGLGIMLVGLINYFILMRNKKDERIVKFYEMHFNNPKQKRLGTTLIAIYVVLTLIAFFLSANFVRSQQL